jgi:hypothetical protein
MAAACGHKKAAQVCHCPPDRIPLHVSAGVVCACVHVGPCFRCDVKYFLLPR